MFLHLAFHFDLRNEGFQHSQYSWVVPPLEDEQAIVMAELCMSIWNDTENHRIPYAFQFVEGSRFSHVGRLFLAPGGRGLSCATFILAVFESHGFPLLRCGEWPIRPEDEPEMLSLVAQLEQIGAEAEHIKAVREALPCARFRPEEVAGACAAPDIPAGFSFCEWAGGELLQRIPIGTA